MSFKMADRLAKEGIFLLSDFELDGDIDVRFVGAVELCERRDQAQAWSQEKFKDYAALCIREGSRYVLLLCKDGKAVGQHR